jgi:hypothetical protein
VPGLDALADAEQLCLLSVYGEYVIAQTGIGRHGTEGWLHGEPEVLRSPRRDEVGEAVLRSLAASFKEKTNAPHRVPPDWEPELRRQVGARSETAFVNGTRLVIVATRRRRMFGRKELVFMPTRLVPREGHSVKVEEQIESGDRSPERIVRCLEEALLKGEPRPTELPWTSAN